MDEVNIDRITSQCARDIMKCLATPGPATNMEAMLWQEDGTPRLLSPADLIDLHRHFQGIIENLVEAMKSAPAEKCTAEMCGEALKASSDVMEGFHQILREQVELRAGLKKFYDTINPK
jgi:hypothetical protein